MKKNQLKYFKKYSIRFDFVSLKLKNQIKLEKTKQNPLKKSKKINIIFCF